MEKWSRGHKAIEDLTIGLFHLLCPIKVLSLDVQKNSDPIRNVSNESSKKIDDSQESLEFLPGCRSVPLKHVAKPGLVRTDTGLINNHAEQRETDHEELGLVGIDGQVD